MNDVKRARITAFLNDETVSSAVFEVLQDSFLREHANYSVHEYAAQTLAFNYLRSAWRDLEKQRLDKETEAKVSSQIGL